MDVHRCRFVPYQPSAINAIAFSHPKTKSGKHATIARLAVGRANGDIEIWNAASGTWLQELIIRGGRDRSIDGLVWANEPDQDLGDGRVRIGKSRLFSIGYTSTVTEWDLETGKPKRHASGQHGDIWCIAAQPPARNDGSSENANKLIAGTIDGELVMYTLEDDDLRFQRVLVKSPTKKAQMVSIAFQSRKVVIVGCSDSTIRAYDMTRGHMIRRMTLGSDLAGGSKDTIVWSVKCLPNGNIVSGDSTGQICIWDGTTYTQAQRIQGHKQDVLSLAVSADGSTIMSGGMDRKTVLYKQSTGAGQRWSKVWGRRYHNHDVKAMASFEHAKTSVVVSGGPDATLVAVPLKEMGRENHRVVGNLPQQAPVLSASQARFVVSWWDREVHIWSLRQPASDILEAGEYDVNQNRKLLKTIVVKGDANIASASINSEGTLLIVSTSTDVKAFELEHSDPERPSDVTVGSLELPEAIAGAGATKVQLSPDGKWLALVQDGSRVVAVELNIAKADEPTFTWQRLGRVARKTPRYILNGGLGTYDRTITHLAFSADSKMLAAADLAGYVDTWVVRADAATNGNKNDQEEEESDDSDDSDEEESAKSSIQWVRNPKAKLLPKLPATPVVLSFSDDVPSKTVEDYTLVTVTSSWNILAFHPLQGALTPWSRRHPGKALPAPVQDLLDLAKGAIWQGSRLWLYGVSFLFMLDLSQDLPFASGDAAGQQLQLGKRKRTGPTSGAGGRMDREGLKPQQIYKHSEDKEEDVEVDRQQQDAGDDSDEDMTDAPADGELSQLRADKNGSQSKVTLEDDNNGDGRKKWWITYKYRPVLGVVPLASGEDQLEIALVERPLWDVDMKESYYAGESWERR